MKIDFLTTDIGRGHRFYLEGLLREVRRLAPEVETEFFLAPELSHGISRFFWRMALALYRSGSRPGLVGACYNRFRRSQSPGGSSIAHSALGRDLRRWLQTRRNLAAAVVVDHSLLVELLIHQTNRPRVVYMHGELVAPEESLTCADLTLVPTDEVHRRFIESGCQKERLALTGLCVESALVPLADSARLVRLRRISEGAALTGAFFTSGAEPANHCDQILRAVLSMQKTSLRSLVFARHGGRLERLVRPYTGNHIELLVCKTILDEEELLASRFKELDYFVAPSHERTNWAFGLALPFFMLSPVFGSFAPLNRELALKSANAVALRSGRESIDFAAALQEARISGRLAEMNERTTEAIGGFTRSAELMIEFAREAPVRQAP